MPSHIPVTAFRNSSFVSHRCLKAAAKTATIATTASTGPATAPNALPSDVTEPVLPASFTPSFVTPFVSAEKPVITDPTVDMILPRAISKGPIAAAIKAIFTAVCFWTSSRLFSLSTNVCTFSTAARTAGISISPKEMAKPSSADLSSVSCPERLSSCVSAICCAAPPESAIDCCKLSHVSPVLARSALTADKSVLLKI